MSVSRKKKRKGYSPQASANRIGRAAVRGLAAAFVSGVGHKVVNLKHLKPVPVSANCDYGMKKVVHKWSVCISVICRTKAGAPYCEHEFYDCFGNGEPYLYSNLADGLGDAHHQLAQSIKNKKDVVAFAWVASPDGHRFESDEVEQLYQNLGGMNYASGWEHEADQIAALEESLAS